jgi:AcrR family transcriptional regulator
MPLKPAGVSRRRRGRVLEEALLEAAWTELTERGYDEFTIDAAAKRAGTSRAVLYRRWPSKQELVHAALINAVAKDLVVAPDTGTLRGDVLALLRQANTKRARVATLLMAHLGDLYRATGTSLSELIASIEGGPDSAMDAPIQRAIARGEIRPEHLTQRVAQLPVALFRYEILMTLKPVPDNVLEEIVDSIFLPLVHRGDPADGAHPIT